MEALQIQIYETIRLGEEKIEAPHTSFGVLGRFLCAFKTSFRIVNTLPRPPSFQVNKVFNCALSFI